MKYGWLLILLGILTLSFFNNFLSSSKSGLASLIQLESMEEPKILRQNNREALVAKIYSTYPLNHRNFLSINAGSKDGVSAGMPVTFDGNFLLGKIIEISETSSIVRTIFDKDFSLPVRLGDGEVNALLVGGHDPRLNLIEKNFGAEEETMVFSAGKDFPYGLKIGKVGKIIDSLADSFKTASLELPYQIKDLRTAIILLK